MRKQSLRYYLVLVKRDGLTGQHQLTARTQVNQQPSCQVCIFDPKDHAGVSRSEEVFVLLFVLTTQSLSTDRGDILQILWTQCIFCRFLVGTTKLLTATILLPTKYKPKMEDDSFNKWTPFCCITVGVASWRWDKTKCRASAVTYPHLPTKMQFKFAFYTFFLHAHFLRFHRLPEVHFMKLHLMPLS